MVLDGRSEVFKKKLAFSKGGTHIDVTTLARNAYFFSKMQDLPFKTLAFRGSAESILKIYLSMGAESVIGVSNSLDLR